VDAALRGAEQGVPLVDPAIIEGTAVGISAMGRGVLKAIQGLFEDDGHPAPAIEVVGEDAGDPEQVLAVPSLGGGRGLEGHDDEQGHRDRGGEEHGGDDPAGGSAVRQATEQRQPADQRHGQHQSRDEEHQAEHELVDDQIGPVVSQPGPGHDQAGTQGDPGR
jgi:hypothetical protein